ncbi:Uncharacterised protein [Chlamydia trachomatis]|nr:Uncharacterised protein [Chlamydia trachomatis]
MDVVLFFVVSIVAVLTPALAAPGFANATEPAIQHVPSVQTAAKTATVRFSEFVFKRMFPLFFRVTSRYENFVFRKSRPCD